MSRSDPKAAAIYTRRVDRAPFAERAALRTEAAAGVQGVARRQNLEALDVVSSSKTG